MTEEITTLTTTTVRDSLEALMTAADNDFRLDNSVSAQTVYNDAARVSDMASVDEETEQALLDFTHEYLALKHEYSITYGEPDTGRIFENALFTGLLVGGWTQDPKYTVGALVASTAMTLYDDVMRTGMDLSPWFWATFAGHGVAEVSGATGPWEVAVTLGGSLIGLGMSIYNRNDERKQLEEAFASEVDELYRSTCSALLTRE